MKSTFFYFYFYESNFENIFFFSQKVIENFSFLRTKNFKTTTHIIFFLWSEVSKFIFSCKLKSAGFFFRVEFWKYSFFPQKGIQKFSPFFCDLIFAANNNRKYYFNMVSLTRTSFTAMQYTELREIGSPIYLLSHSDISGPFSFTLCYYEASFQLSTVFLQCISPIWIRCESILSSKKAPLTGGKFWLFPTTKIVNLSVGFSRGLTDFRLNKMLDNPLKNEGDSKDQLQVVEHLSIRVLQFSKEDIEMFLLQAEASFKLGRSDNLGNKI